MQRDACSYGCCCCCCCSGLLAVFRDAGCIHACSFPDAAMHSPEQVASMLAVFRDAACCLQQAASSMLVGCNHPCCLGCIRCIRCIRCIHSPEQHACSSGCCNNSNNSNSKARGMQLCRAKNYRKDLISVFLVSKIVLINNSV